MFGCIHGERYITFAVGVQPKIEKEIIAVINFVPMHRTGGKGYPFPGHCHRRRWRVAFGRGSGGDVGFGWHDGHRRRRRHGFHRAHLDRNDRTI